MGCIILTGIPGVGKTTVGRAVSSALTNVAYRSFGDIARELAAQDARAQGLDVRVDLDAVVTSELIARAKTRLVDEASALRPGEFILLDSHTATGTPYGIRATPDGKDRLTAMRVVGFINLVADPEVVLARRVGDAENVRHGDELSHISQLQGVLMSITTACAQSIQVPAYFLRANGGVDDVIDGVSGIVRLIQDWSARSGD